MNQSFLSVICGIVAIMWTAVPLAAQSKLKPGVYAHFVTTEGNFTARLFEKEVPKTVDNFTRATIEAYGYIFKKENKESVKQIIAKNLRLPNNEAAEDFYIEALDELDRKPYPSLEGFRTVVKYVAEQNPKAASIKAEEIVDTSWLKKLDSEGFFDKVYGDQ